jgi:hypothetical protein
MTCKQYVVIKISFRQGTEQARAFGVNGTSLTVRNGTVMVLPSIEW